MAERKRERIQPNEDDSRFVRRDDEGRFSEDQVDEGRSLTQDRQQEAKTKSKRGHGDKGDRNA
ncbi:MAG TPA: hypothetical protein VK922_05825 [Gemmatimonadaceae bacterium]|nr:hypothetical protein [Gemmatimonadaceae bacterium]